MRKRIARLLLVWLLLVPASTAPAQTADARHRERPEDAMEARCRLEVEELHQFFQDWTTGAVEASDEELDRFAAVTADAFVIISPSGRVTDRQTMLERMQGAHGRTQVPDARIWIENFELRQVEGDVAIVTYEEWQQIGGVERGRLSTAVFRASEGTLNGVEWLHVHETWLPKK